MKYGAAFVSLTLVSCFIVMGATMSESLFETIICGLALLLVIVAVVLILTDAVMVSKDIDRW